MGQLKETVVAGIKSERAATDPTDLVRLQEMEAALADRPTNSQVTSAIEAAADPLTKLDTASVKITLAGSQISANVSVGGGLVIGSSGVELDRGTGHLQVPYGDHEHANDHAQTTGSETNSTVATVGEDQVVHVSVKLQGGYLFSNSEGVGLYTSALATSSHTHPSVTLGAAGFMSPYMLTYFNTVVANDLATAFTDSDTIEWNSRGNCDVKYYTGLKVVEGEGLQVDFTAVASKIHTHSEYITGQPVNGSYRIMPDNIYIWDSDAYAADNSKPWRAIGCSNGQVLFGPPVAL